MNQQFKHYCAKCAYGTDRTDAFRRHGQSTRHINKPDVNGHIIEQNRLLQNEVNAFKQLLVQAYTVIDRLRSAAAEHGINFRIDTANISHVNPGATPTTAETQQPNITDP
jgi:hypothetical protein